MFIFLIFTKKSSYIYSISVSGVNGNIKMGRDGFRKANYLISSYNDAGQLVSYLSFQLYQHVDNITGNTIDDVVSWSSLFPLFETWVDIQTLENYFLERNKTLHRSYHFYLGQSWWRSTHFDTKMWFWWERMPNWCFCWISRRIHSCHYCRMRHRCWLNVWGLYDLSVKRFSWLL